MKKRARFINLLIVWVLLASCSGQSAPQPTLASVINPQKPNIVFILADDLDAAAIQYMPKLKALITDQGLTFTNYSVAMSLCCPSRATTLRGQYPHNTQVLGNVLPDGGFEKFYNLGEENSTVAVWLQAAGYRTMLAGKYMNSFPTKSDRMHIPPGWTEWYSAMAGKPYTEFDYTLNENGKKVKYGHTDADYGTDVYVGKTLDFIQKSVEAGQPFFAYLAPYAPHSPYIPAPRHEHLFTDLQAPRSPNFDEADVSDKPQNIRDYPPLTQKEIDTIDEVYRQRLRSLQAVDEGLEAIVNKLIATGQLSNTYIFFTSDNGFHLGNHRQVTGKISPYQEELLVTMIVRGPDVPAGQTLPYLTGNTDLAPTWADLAHAAVPSFVDGRSLVPLMRANPPPMNGWRQVFGIENGVYSLPDPGAALTATPDTDPSLLEPSDGDIAGSVQASKKNAGGPDDIPVPPLRGFRSQTLSYVEYITGEVELYDLKADPYQLNNLAATADPKLLAVLSARVKALSTCQADTCRTIEDAPLNLP